MLKTKKELMLELGKLNLELTEYKDRLGAVISLFDSVPQDVILSNLRAIFAKLGGAPPLSQIKVDGYDIILASACKFNGVAERFIKTEKSRNNKWVYARAFYCLLCLELGLRSENELAEDIGRDRTTIVHYKKMYKTKVRFRKMYEVFVKSLM